MVQRRHMNKSPTGLVKRKPTQVLNQVGALPKTFQSPGGAQVVLIITRLARQAQEFRSESHFRLARLPDVLLYSTLTPGKEPRGTPAKP